MSFTLYVNVNSLNDNAMQEITVKEKIRMIIEINEAENPGEKLVSAGTALGGGIGYNFVENRAFVRTDLRKKVMDRIAEEHLNRREVARAIGFDYQNFYNFLQGKRGLPYEKVEELLALLGIA